MLTSRDLLSAVRTAQGLPSNYALAKLLELREKDVSRWNAGHNVPSDAMAVKLAEMACLDPAYVLACMHAQRCTDENLRPILERIAAHVERAAAALAAVILSVLVTGSPDALAQAPARVSADSAHSQAVLGKNIHCSGF